MKKITNIILLAGGDCDRFWPLHDKFLFSFVGKPLILHLLDGIAPYGEKIWIVCGKDNEETVRGFSLDNICVVVQGTKGTGMAAAVLSLKSRIKGDVLILNASDIFDFTVLRQYQTIIEKTAPDYIFLAKQTTEYFPGAYTVFSNGKATGFIEKPAPENVPSHTLKLVADYFSDFQGFIRILEKTQTTDDNQYEEAINNYLKHNIHAEYVVYDGKWLTLKYSWHVLSMMQYYLSGMKDQVIDSSVSVSKTAVITGLVQLGKNVKIGDFVKITGPCFIGDNTVVADYSLVRESHIGDRCLIGSSSEVARSYLGHCVMLHRNYIGDSVLDRNVLIGAGTVTANFRFDEKKIQAHLNGSKISTQLRKLGAVIGSSSKIGVNATLYPGVKIGMDSLVAPGERIKKDIHNSVYYADNSVHKKII